MWEEAARLPWEVDRQEVPAVGRRGSSLTVTILVRLEQGGLRQEGTEGSKVEEVCVGQMPPGERASRGGEGEMRPKALITQLWGRGMPKKVDRCPDEGTWDVPGCSLVEAGGDMKQVWWVRA